VGPLSPEEAARLALARLGQSGATAEACATRIAAEAEGSPFFIEELIRYARAVRAAPGGAHPSLSPSIASPQSAVALSVPTLEEVLAARVTALPPEARRLLEVVAVAGGPIARRVALEAAEVGSGAERALHVLCVGGLLWTGGVRDEDAIDTYHDRIRERVLASIGPDALAGHYGALAQAQAAEALSADTRCR
jgi:predicted ATPase